MSKIKVDTIQSTQHTTSTIGFTSTGATVNGDCSATTFTGSGANLTNLPSANLTGALPAIDGSALSGVGGGGLELHSATVVPSAVSSVSITGLANDAYYLVIGRKIEFSQGDFIKVGFLDSSGNQQTGICDYVRDLHSSTSTYTGYDDLNGYAGGNTNKYQFYHRFGTAFGYSNGYFSGQNYGTYERNEMYYSLNTSATQVHGLKYMAANGTIDAGSTFLIYKFKES